MNLDIYIRVFFIYLLVDIESISADTWYLIVHFTNLYI